MVVQQLRRTVHEVVGRINGHYGTLTHVPIHHLDRSLSFQELCALYAITDVLLVTSLRDGMNLVSYEYVACQSDNAGAFLTQLEFSFDFFCLPYSQTTVFMYRSEFSFTFCNLACTHLPRDDRQFFLDDCPIKYAGGCRFITS